MTKFTADRAGLLVCQDMNIAITALMKLGGLPNEYLNAEIIQGFLEQAREFNIEELGRLDQVTKLFSFMEFQHPWMVMRASELLKWVDDGVYDQWLRSDDAELPEETGMLEKNSIDEDKQDWKFLGSW